MTDNTITFIPALPNENLYLVIGKEIDGQTYSQIHSAPSDDDAYAAHVKHIIHVVGSTYIREIGEREIFIEQCTLLSDLVVQPSCSHEELLEKLPPEAIHAKYDEDSIPTKIIVDGLTIEDNVFDEELTDYRLEDREELMDNLISFIAEARNDANRSSNSLQMKQDLFMLSELDDDYVWSSTLTNEYISPSKNPEKFNEICREILAANRMAEQ